MHFLCLVALLAQSAAPFSTEQCIGRVKSLLAAFGAPGPYRLQAVGDGKGTGRRWFVRMTDARKESYAAYVDSDGRSFLMLADKSVGRVMERGSQRASPESRYGRMVTRWMRKVAGDETTRLETLTVDGKGNGHAFFAVLRNGYPVYPPPRRGCEFYFSAPDGRFLYCDAPPTPPAMPVIRPLFHKNGALAALKRIYDTEITPRAMANHLTRVWYELTEEPEIGYYCPEAGRKPLLVWRMRFMSYRSHAGGGNSSGNGMLIDAVTGQRVPTSVVP